MNLHECSQPNTPLRRRASLHRPLVNGRARRATPAQKSASVPPAETVCCLFGACGPGVVPPVTDLMLLTRRRRAFPHLRVGLSIERRCEYSRCRVAATNIGNPPRLCPSGEARFRCGRSSISEMGLSATTSCRVRGYFHHSSGNLHYALPQRGLLLTTSRPAAPWIQRRRHGPESRVPLPPRAVMTSAWHPLNGFVAYIQARDTLIR